MPRGDTPLLILQATSPGLPDRLRSYFQAAPDAELHAIGDVGILSGPVLGLCCSVRCPGSVIVQTYDLARALRDAGITVAGGFHSPIEKDCLDILLRGKQPVVICPARGIDRMRMPAPWRSALDSGRLLILSPFSEGRPRTTAALAQERNEFVAAIADAVLVPYASPGGRTEALCRSILSSGKQLWVLDTPENAGLVANGARRLTPAGIAALFPDCTRPGADSAQGSDCRTARDAAECPLAGRQPGAAASAPARADAAGWVDGRELRRILMNPGR